MNSVAFTYGLIPSDKANAIMDRLLAKMAHVEYTPFQYGLPGNLIPIGKDDYLEARRERVEAKRRRAWWFPDLRKPWCHGLLRLLHSSGAVPQLGRKREGDTILFPMLRAFEEGGFQGGAANARTRYGKAWDGTPYGYEGLLVDGYQTLLAVLSR